MVKEDLMKVFKEFHSRGIVNQSTNSTFIALVPKKSQTSKISDFRPISLVTILYKIIAKVSILQFADDIIFFSKTASEHLQNLKIILLVFEQF